MVFILGRYFFFSFGSALFAAQLHQTFKKDRKFLPATPAAFGYLPRRRCSIGSMKKKKVESSFTKTSFNSFMALIDEIKFQLKEFLGWFYNNIEIPPS